MKAILKKILSISLCAALTGGTAVTLPAIVPGSGITASAADTYSWGDYEYTINSDDTIKITKYTGHTSDLVIPQTIGGRKVMDIDKYVFNGDTTIKKLLLPYGMTTVSAYAFYGCYNLEELTLPSTITAIDRYAFDFCSKLKTVVQRGTIENIYNGAFYGCTSLKEFEFVSGLKSIGGYAFTNTGLTSVEIPATVTTIGLNAFGYTYKDSTYTKVSDFTVSGMPGSAADAYAKRNVFTFNSVLQYTTNSDNTLTVTQYTGKDRSVVIPSEIEGKTVSKIGRYAFNGNTTMREVTLPEGIDQVDACAFYGAYALRTVNLPESVKSINNYAFEFCDKLTKVVQKGTIENIGVGAFYGCTELKNFEIKPGLKIIGSSAFVNTGLTSVDIPATVTDIGGHAFGYTYKDSTYTMVEDFTITCDYGSEAYSYATVNGFNIKSTLKTSENEDGTLTITGYSGTNPDLFIPSEINGKTVTSIGEDAFWYNSVVKNVTIPDTVKTIEPYAFRLCKTLETVKIGANVESIGKYAFANCSALSSVDIPNSVKSIGIYAFYNCSSMAMLNLGNSLEAIEQFTFAGCTSLSTVIIPDSVTRIGNGAFYNCTAVSNVQFGKGLVKISDYAFENTELYVVEIPSNVTEIGSYAIGAADMAVEEGNYDYYITGFTICAETGSAAHKYATDNGLEFVATNPVIAAEKITLDKTSLSIVKGKTATFKATITPADTTDKTVSWFTSDKTVATVKNGTVTAVKEGTCTITAKTANGKKATCKVTVTLTAPLNNTSVINSTVVGLSDKVRISASANGGTSPYTYAYYYKRSTNTSWKTLGTEWGTNTSVAFAPTSAAKYDIKVIVKDKTGATAEKLFTVEAVENLELTNVSVVGREKVNLGSAIPMIGKAVGGKSPYTYSFYFKRTTNTNWKLLGDKFTTTASARFKPTAKGSYDIRIDVKDSEGTIKKKLFTATVK